MDLKGSILWSPANTVHVNEIHTLTINQGTFFFVLNHY
jgi:hypothetical protein